MHSLLQSLSGGDRRSIGAANEAVPAVLAQPELLEVLFQGLDGGDPVLRMRCADVAEKVSAKRAQLFLPYKDRLFGLLAASRQQEIRWHVAPILVRLPLSKQEEAKVLIILKTYLNDRSSIVKTMAMQAMADIAAGNPDLRPDITHLLVALTRAGTPAMKARGRKLLNRLNPSQ